MTYIELYTKCYNLLNVNGYYEREGNEDLIDFINNLNKVKRNQYIKALINHKPKYVVDLLHIFDKYFLLDHYDDLIIQFEYKEGLFYINEDMKEKLIKLRLTFLKKMESILSLIIENGLNGNEKYIKGIIMNYFWIKN